MALHEVQLKGYSVRPGNLSLGTYDSYGIEQLHVTADDSWDGLDILAVFHAPDWTATKVVVGADGMLNVPPEATAKQAGNGRIVFVGLAENVQRITVDMGYNIKPHSDIEGDNPGTPTPDVVQQILENSNHAVSIATAAQDAAENARQAAEDAAQKAGEGAGGAAQSAAAAKKSAEEAAASSESAAGKAEESASSASAAAENARAAQTAQGSAENAAQAAADAAGAARQAAGVAGSAAKASSTSAGEAAQSAEAAETAKKKAEDAAKKALEAKTGSENALQDADAAKDAASGYADAAAEKATAAAASEKNAAKSENSAADSAAAAKKSAEDADNTANSIKDSMAQISENKEAVSQLKEDTAALKKRQNVLVGSETGNPASCDDAFAAPLCGLTVYGKSTQDGTPSPDNPVPIVSAGDGGSVAVKVTGRNLLNIPDGSATARGLTVTAKDGLISISGTAISSGYAWSNIQPFITSGVVILSSSITSPKVKLVSETWGVVLTSGIADKMSNMATRIVFIVTEGQTYNLTGVKVQLELGTTATTYEPYHEQLLTLPTPNGLPGIPVTSGGNYTDQNGQQWVCDEIDLERGVKVQRVNIVDLSTCKITGTTEFAVTRRLTILLPIRGHDYKTKALCNKLQFITSFDKDVQHFYVDKNNVLIFIPIGAKNPEEGEYILFYALATPIETPLTPAEIAAYKAITAYAPDTVVQASDGAGIKLDYQRDVNLVVKNLEDAIASMTTT